MDGAKIGLVWEITTLGNYKIIAHGGATGGYRANLLFDKEKELAAVVLSNSDISPRCVLAPIFEAEECKIPEYQKVDTALQMPFLGKFHATAIGMDAEIFLENGVLGIQPQHQPKLRLWAKTETEYEILQAPAMVRFVKGPGGQVDSFLLLQGGKEYEFVRK